METGGRNARVVSLCGADGVGKTTLFRHLRKRLEGPRVFFAPRGPATCEALVERHFPREFGDERDWIDAPFGNAIAAACALDFVAFYEQVVAPALRAYDLVVTDRFAQCFLAYARSLRTPDQTAIGLLRGVPAPDHVFYVTVPEEMAAERLLARGDAPNPFEHPYCQRRFRCGYDAVWAEFPHPVHVVSNTGPLADTVELLAACIGGLA